jgi:heme exporter protein A
MLLSVDNLSVSRGGISLFEGLNFTVSTGEFVLINGGNGVGKTSLLRSIAGLQPIDKGNIAINADNFIFAGDANGIKTSLTVLENLRFWSAIFGGKNLHEALEKFQLRQLKNRFAGKLSAGQKRRLSLARLLLTDRPIWLLDEPTVSLDKRSMQQFSKILKNHLEAGGAAVVATHIDLGLTLSSISINLEDYQMKNGNINTSAKAFL